MFKSVAQYCTRYWYSPSLHLRTGLLLPFSWLFAVVVAVRRLLYRGGVIRVHHFPVPVIVVGNIAIGGTGKTPLVIALAHLLRSFGYQPAIVSRGYGGKNQAQPYWVKPTDAASDVGDEAILLAQRAECPIVICTDRVAAVRDLVEQSHCNIVISDDGLQHYRLGRDIEIAVVDGERRDGNKKMLPAGPLREPLIRLKEVDFVAVNGGNGQDAFSFALEPTQLISLHDHTQIDLTHFPHKRIHAVAGIGNPERFFTLLKQAGFDVMTHTFPDHYLYQPYDLDFTDALPIVMTEKDAVKCGAFADDRYWYLRITAKINSRFQEALLEKLKRLEVCNDSEKDVARHACRITRHAQHDDTSERT